MFDKFTNIIRFEKYKTFTGLTMKLVELIEKQHEDRNLIDN